jgi:hypothetical protein
MKLAFRIRDISMDVS